MDKPMDPKAATKVLFEIDDILNEFRVPYVLICGVALGMYRNHGFIPHDDDFDICALWEDFEPVVDRLTMAFKSAGFRTHSISKPLDSVRCFKLDKDGIHTDFPAFFRHGDVRWCPYMYKDMSIVLPAHMLESPEGVTFEGREFNVPSPICDYLRMEYGVAYMVPLRRAHGWKSESHKFFRPDMGVGLK